jgi:hypothetical protein
MRFNKDGKAEKERRWQWEFLNIQHRESKKMFLLKTLTCDLLLIQVYFKSGTNYKTVSLLPNHTVACLITW